MTLRHPVAVAILAVLAAAVFGILLRPLTPIDETRYLSVAWEMHQTGNWLVPSKNFAPYSDKPPLLFWAVNLVWLFTGVSEFTGRLVVPVFAALAIWLSARLAGRLWPDEAGIGGRAALALAGLLVFDLSAGLTMFDVPLAVATLTGLLCLVDARDRPASLWPWAGFGAALAMGVLAKGPVILFHLLPAAILLPWWGGAPLRWSHLLPRLCLGLLVALALVALWLVPAVMGGGPAYRDAVLWHQSAGRLSESFAHARPMWFYLALLPVVGFPLILSPALWRAARATRWLAEPGLRLCLIWLGAALVLFSLTSGKQLHYLVPELAAAALIAARLSRGLSGFSLLPAGLVLGLLALGAILAGAGLVPLGKAGEMLEPRSALIAWALLVLAICWLAVREGGFAGAMLISLGGLCATNLLIGITEVGPNFSTHPIAEALAPYDKQGIAYTGAAYHAEFNLPARLTRPVATPADAGALADWSRSHPQGVILAGQGPDAPSWSPFKTFRFRARDYGLWSVADAP